MVSSISSNNISWVSYETVTVVCVGAGVIGTLVSEVFFRTFGNICQEAFIEIDRLRGFSEETIVSNLSEVDISS